MADIDADAPLRSGTAIPHIDPALQPVEGAPFPPGLRARPAVARPVLGLISAGGVIGSLARYGLGVAFPHQPTGIPWATFAINVSGCLLIGALMVLITDVWPARRLLRPFLGTGLLGGYTTFSTYVVDIQHLLGVGAARTALAYLAYLAGTLLAALATVQAGITLTRAAFAFARRRHGRPHHSKEATR
jgi:fluoride exporter